MMVLGIDPGETGGLALVSRDANIGVVLHSGIMMPLVTATKKPTVSMDAVWSWLDPYPGITHGVIENVWAFPKQGVSSSFQFGRMFGGAEVVLQVTCLHMLHVTPQSWKKYWGLSSDKAASIEKATEIFNTAEHWPLKKHEGIAEAALIALYGLLHFESEA